MPRFKLAGYDKFIEYASEDDLLDFANRLRAAGGANVLEALLPSVPEEPTACLIANALNFSSSVSPASEDHYDDRNGESSWVMTLPVNTSTTQLEAIAAVIGSPPRESHDVFGGDLSAPIGYCFTLPRLIGNAAQAFDNRKGWTTKYNTELEAPRHEA
jgi:hypothetical protein